MIADSDQWPRLFYALWPDDTVRAALMRMQARVQGRKTPYDQFHLTLAFLGRQTLRKLPALISILTQLPLAPVTLTIDRLGYFKPQRIVWAGMHETPVSLSRLHRSLHDLLKQNGISADSETDFHPHITLARAAEGPDEMAFNIPTWYCRQIVLVESTETESGVACRIVGTATLQP